MAINTGDTRIAFIEEATKGVTPATPAMNVCDNLAGSAVRPVADTGNRETRRNDRTGSGQFLTNRRAEGSIEMEFRRDTNTIEKLMEGALGGTWTSNVLKGGTGAKSYTVEETFYDGATATYRRSSGCEVSGMEVSAEFNGVAKIKFDLLGLSATTSNTIITGATYTNAGTKLPIVGEQISAVSVGSLTGLVPTSLMLKVTSNKETKGSFGSASASFIGTGSRSIEFELKVLVSNLDYYSLTNSGNPNVAVSWTMGSGTASQYTFLIPAASPSIPEDAEDGTALELTLKFVADRDATEATDIKITRN